MNSEDLVTQTSQSDTRSADRGAPHGAPSNAPSNAPTNAPTNDVGSDVAKGRAGGVGRWHSAHIYHYDPDTTDALLLNAIRPLIAALAEHGMPDAYFVRHWLRGPHIRVHVRTDPDTFERVAKPLIERIAGGYLNDNPSTHVPDMAREERAHAWLAELEQEQGPITPWFPDNSIRYLPYDRRLHVLGTAEAAEHLAEFHVETTPLAFRILEEYPNKSARFGTLVSLMLASAQIGCPPITNGYLSYRSHAEGFFANSGDPRRMRTRYEELYQANREPLAGRLAAVLGQLEDGVVGEDEEPAVRHLPEWAAIARRVLARAEDLESRGLLRMPAFLADEPDGRRGMGWENISDFHRALMSNTQVRDELAAASWFTVYRVLLNYQYLLFNRLGLTPAERFLLCHLAARTVEDANDMTVDKVIDLLRAGPAGWGPR